MKSVLFTFYVAIGTLGAYAQTNTHTIESGTSGTVGDAIIRIEADKDNSDENDNPRLELYQDGGAVGAHIGFNGNWAGTTNQPDNLFRIGTRYNGDHFNRFVIRPNNGNIGIGTADPISLLHISSSSGDAALTLEADVDNNEEQDNPRINFIQDGSLVNALIGLEGNPNATAQGTLANAFILGSLDATARPVQIILKDEVQLTVNDLGVGIGTTTPSEKLEVNGTIRSKEIKVEAAPWPDYVFSDGYELPDLGTTADFIKANRAPSRHPISHRGGRARDFIGRDECEATAEDRGTDALFD